jgi:hypothetical protein
MIDTEASRASSSAEIFPFWDGTLVPVRTTVLLILEFWIPGVENVVN